MIVEYTLEKSLPVLLAIFIAVLFLIVSCDNDNNEDTENGLFGAITPSDEEIASYPKSLPPGAMARASELNNETTFSKFFLDGTLISSIESFLIPSSSLPLVRAQGTEKEPGFPGSCEVWSAGYAMGSFTANKVNNKNIQEAVNNVSTAFVFMWIFDGENRTCAKGAGGTSAKQTLEYLVHNSAPSLNAVRYEPNCDYLNSIDTNRTFNTGLSIGSWSNYNPTETTLDDIKGYLVQNQIVQISIVVPYLFGEYTGGVFTGDEDCPSNPVTPCVQRKGVDIACLPDSSTPTGCSQHGVAIVGFDDNLGAFRIMNSFGTDWGELGFMWLSYDTFEKIFLNSYLAHPVSDVSSSEFKTSNSKEAEIINAFQWIDRENGIPKNVYLIFETRFHQPLILSDITITSPEGKALTHTYAHSFRNGFHYIVRHDGLQFEPGLYTINMTGETITGEKIETTLETLVEKADDTVPVGLLPDIVSGTNGQVVEFK